MLHPQVVRSITITALALIIVASVVTADEPSPRELVQAKRHLARIGVELHRYRDDHGQKFPASALRDRSGRPLLSWRVAMLPMLGEDELYRQFKLDEPWDSPANKPLLARMPAVYAPFGPVGGEPGSTFLQVITGPGTLFEQADGYAYDAIPDGASSTLLVVEGLQAVPWTRPEDLRYNPKGPPPRLGGQFKQGSLALFADGAVALIKPDIDEPTLRALITRDGAETLARQTLRDHVVPIRR